MVNRRDFMAAMAVTASAPVAAATTATAGRTSSVSLQSANVPGEVAVAIYTPPGHDRDATAPLPLLLFLHGGNGSSQDLLRFTPAIDAAIVEGRLPPLVIAMPSARRSLYMDYRDGSERWESFILADLLPHLRRTLAVSTERRQTFIAGYSMGGLGSLRIAFKHPHLFGAVAALEPAIEPAQSWRDVGPQVKFWRPDGVVETMFGSPIDQDYWTANSPAAIASRDPERLLDLAIYLEVGDQDMLHLHQGTEYLHRILFDAGIGHEYRLVRGADHVGPSLPPRVLDALGFIGRQIRPPGWIDDSVLKARSIYDGMKRAAGMAVEPVDPRRISGS